jgi:anti-sigma28 factor (negative regulator of flagellin synthesis)
MKINDANIAGLASNGIGKPQEAEQGARVRQNRTGDGASSSTDQVQLSNLSETLRASESESPERAAHVERLSAEVQAGRYQVDSAVLSKNIVQDSITG